jgi:diphthamide biosynthesis protein 3
MSIYEEVEIEDLDYDPIELLYTYPCPCGDKFRITLEDLWDGEDIAPCPSCTLRIMIIYDEEDLPPLPDSDDDSSDEGEEEKNDDIKDEEEKFESLADSLENSLKVA